MENAHSTYISLVIAIKNERDNIEPLVREIVATMDSQEYGYEIIYVDDGSTDGSFEKLEQLRQEVPRLRAIQFARNFGQSAALVAGIESARGELVATLDGDLQNDPADFPRMLQILSDRSIDMVTGVRTKRRDNVFRRVQSRFANFVRNKITGDNVRDSACGIRVFRRQSFDRIHKFNGMHRFMTTLFRMKGYKVEEVPVNHRERRFGKAKYGMLNRVFKATADLFAVRWLQKNTIRYTIKTRL